MIETPAAGRKICCIGEVLWDALPEGLFLGGAPLNVCYHLAVLGEEARMISRVGRDRLGKEALRSLNNKGVTTDCIQIDEEVETGFVKVNLTQKEGPDYEITEPAAWDFISFTEEVQALSENIDIVVFGTLGQRHKVSRKTIQRVVAQSDVAVYDVNLRPPFDDPTIVETSLQKASIVKMNNDELMILAGWFGWPGQRKQAIKQLAESFNCQQVCITCGKGGAVLYNEGTWTQQEAFEAEVVDTVGSGDAFLAALVYGLVHFGTDTERLRFANLLGAFVATKAGANPPYSLEEIKSFARENEAHVKLNSSENT